MPGAEAAAGQAPAGGTGGGLPVTGIEVFQLALLGIALLLVGARLRVLALRRRRGPAEPTWRESDLAYEEDFAAPITARRTTPPRPERRTSAPRQERRATAPRPERRAATPRPERHSRASPGKPRRARRVVLPGPERAGAHRPPPEHGKRPPPGPMLAAERD